MGYLGEFYLIDWNIDNNIQATENSFDITVINSNQEIQDTFMFGNTTNTNTTRNIFIILE